MEHTNHMVLEVESRSCNEGLARIAVAAFCTQLNPTLEEVADVKTAVSEAITNCIVHAYEKETDIIRIQCWRRKKELIVAVEDKGKGMEDVKKKPWNLYLPPCHSRIGVVWALLLWRLLWMRFRWSLLWEREPL